MMPVVLLNSILDEERLYDVKTAVIDLTSKWRSLGEALLLKQTTLETIESSHHSPRDHLSNVLMEWLRNYSSSRVPSWCWLVEVVAAPAGGNNQRLAEQIARQHPIVTSES